MHNDPRLYQSTLDKWGEQAQYDQAIEECAELITTLKHYKRGKAGAEEVIAELADVTLMIGQLSWMFGADRVSLAIDEKLRKLNNMLTED